MTNDIWNLQYVLERFTELIGDKKGVVSYAIRDEECFKPVDELLGPLVQNFGEATLDERVKALLVGPGVKFESNEKILCSMCYDPVKCGARITFESL